MRSAAGRGCEQETSDLSQDQRITDGQEGCPSEDLDDEPPCGYPSDNFRLKFKSRYWLHG